MILAFLAWLGHLATKSRRKSCVNQTRRKEYRYALLVAPLVVLVALSGMFWFADAGITPIQFAGVSLVMVGTAFVIIAITNHRPAKYPRSYWLVAGLPLILTGPWIPFCTHAQAVIACSCMGAVMCGLIAVVLHIQLRRQVEGPSHAAD